MRLNPWRVIDHTLTTESPYDRVTSCPQNELNQNTIKIDDKLTGNYEENHRIVKGQATVGLISAAIGFGGGIAITRY